MNCGIRAPFVGGGACTTAEDGSLATAQVGIPAVYEATIMTSTGAFHDEGITTVGSQVVTTSHPNQPTEFFAFGENFLSNLVAVIPIETPGRATGGGQIAHAGGPGGTAFGFEAGSDDRVLRARCVVDDHASGTYVHCLDATSYVQIGNTATFTGSAKVNGVPTDYRIEVEDGGESGIGRDTFTITTGTGYSGSSFLTEGNIWVHPED